MKVNKIITRICMIISIIFFIALIYLYQFAQFNKEIVDFLKNFCWSLLGSSFITAITTYVIYKNEFKEKETELFLQLISILKKYTKFINNNYLPKAELKIIQDTRNEYIGSCEKYFEELDYLYFYLGIDKVQFSGLFSILKALDELDKDVEMICTYKKCSEPPNEKILEYYERCKKDIDIVEEKILRYSKKKYDKMFRDEIKYRNDPIKNINK